MAKKLLFAPAKEKEVKKKKLLFAPAKTEDASVVEEIPAKDDSVDKLLTQIETQEAVTGAPELTPTLQQEVDLKDRLAKEKNALKKAQRDEFSELYGDEILYKDVTLDGEYSKEVYDDMRNEAVDKISQSHQYDYKVDEIKQLSDTVTDDQARSLVLDEFNEYVYDNVFDSREKATFDAMKNVNNKKKAYDENPKDQTALMSLKKANDALSSARGDQYKPLLDDDGEFVDQQWKDMTQEDREEIQLKAAEYTKWSPEKLYSLFTDLTAKNKGLDDEKDRRYQPIASYREMTEGVAGIKPQYYHDALKEVAKVNELKMPVFKDLKAISHALLLNRDMSSVQTNFAQFIGRGVLEGAGLNHITTESQLQERFNKVILDAGGSITEDQYESASRGILDQAGMAIGNSLPIMAELAVTRNLTGAIAKGLKLTKYAAKLKTLARAKYGRSGESFVNLIVNVGENEARGALEYGIVPDEKISAAMGVGESLASRLNNFIFKGKNVGRIGEFVTRTISGGAIETIAEFSGDFTHNLSKNGFDTDKALEETFGKTGDEALDKILVTAITCAMFSGTANISVLTKTKSSIDAFPDGPAKIKAQEAINEMIEDVEQSTNQSVDSRQSDLSLAVNEMDGAKTPGLSVSTESDNTIKKVINKEKSDVESAQKALEEVNQVSEVLNEKTPEESEYTPAQINKTNQALDNTKAELETYIEQQSQMKPEVVEETKIDETKTEEDAKEKISDQKEISDGTKKEGDQDIGDGTQGKEGKSDIEEELLTEAKANELSYSSVPTVEEMDARDEYYESIIDKYDENIAKEELDKDEVTDDEVFDVVSKKMSDGTYISPDKLINERDALFNNTVSSMRQRVTEALKGIDPGGILEILGIKKQVPVSLQSKWLNDLGDKIRKKDETLKNRLISAVGNAMAESMGVDFENVMGPMSGWGSKKKQSFTNSIESKVKGILDALVTPASSTEVSGIELQEGKKVTEKIELTQPKAEPTTEVKAEPTEVKPKKASESVGKTWAMADKASKDLAGVTLTQDNVADFEKVVKESTAALKGLKMLGVDTGKLATKVANISKRIQNAKSRGLTERKKGEKYSIEDLTTSFLDELKKTVDKAKGKMANESKARSRKALGVKGTRTVSGKPTGVIESSVVEDFRVAKDLIDGREVMDLNRAIDILQDPDSSDSEIAQADGAIYGSKLVEGHENWGLEEWVEFEETIKQHAKQSRAEIKAAREVVRKRNKKIRDKIDDSVDMDNVPSTQAEISAKKARKEGYVSPDEAHNKFSKKLVSMYRKASESLKDAKQNIVSSAISWNLHIGTIMSILDANESTAESGALYESIVRPIQDAFSKMTGGVLARNAEIHTNLTGIIDPEFVNEINALDTSQRSKNKKITQRFYDIVEKRIFNSERFTVDMEVDGEMQSFNLKTDDIMKLYAWSKDPVLAEEMATVNKITPEMIETFKKQIGTDMVNFVDYVTEKFMKENYQRMNAVYKDVYYTNMPFVENYFPIKRSGLGTTEDIASDQNLMNTLSASISAIKNRRKTSKPLEIESKNDNGFMKILFDHINDSEHFTAYAKPIRDVNAGMKSKNLNMALDHYGLKKTIMNQLTTAIGKSKQYKQKMLGLEKLYNAYAVAALSGKLVQLPKQASSFINMYPDYAEVAGGGPLGLAKFLADAAYKSTAFAGNPHAMVKMKKDFLLLYDKSPLFRNRVDSEMVSVDFISGTNRKPWTKLSPAQKISAALRSPTKYGDVMGIMLGGSQVYKAALEMTGNEEEAIRKFEEYEKTQQAKNPLFYNNIQLSDSPVVKLFTAFRSSQILMINKSIGAMNSIKRSVKKGGLKNIKSKDVRTLTINWAVSNMLFQSIASLPTLIRGDDEEYLQGLARSGVIGPLNGLFMVGDFAEWIYDIVERGWNKGSTNKIDRLEFGIGIEKIPIDIAKPWTQDNVSAQDATALTALYMLQFAGLPAKTSMGVADGVTEAIEGGLTIEAMEKMMGYTEFQREGSSKKKKATSPGF